MKRESKSKVLGDHKKEGKKLIPPLMGLGSLRETSYTQIIIPEIIWIAILNKKYGIQKGAELRIGVGAVSFGNMFEQVLLCFHKFI